ncbi:unnamed protein product [Gongylonema pulchrum]|uniref:Uncharacterized protein n=1 Tax=Gongylonema pulchrum TaxID=637853 RepID=A0A3P6SKY3_9BILA|nr:unnamed protein product [Gongylonema pulchrum]VDK55714.1 unnamed protein product [Gongylonema pulchrum]
MLITIPAVIVAFSGTIRLGASDKYPSKRPLICNFGGYLGLFAVAAAFFTGWIVMLVAR